MRKVISFSVYGSNPKYLKGAIANAILKKDIYPDWYSLFYVSSSLEGVFTRELEALADEIEIVKEPDDERAMFWRFRAVADFENTLVIVRDVDSRLSKRDLSAVDQWQESGKSLHVIRDHPMHNAPMLGGMWGIRTSALPEFGKSLSQFNPSGYYGEDQEFLWKNVYKPLRNDVFVHDEIFLRNILHHKILEPRMKYEYVGEAFSEFGDFDQNLRDSLEETLSSFWRLFVLKMKSLFMNILGR